MRGTDHSFSPAVSMCLIVCDLETQTVRRPGQALGLCAISKRKCIGRAKLSVLT